MKVASPVPSAQGHLSLFLLVRSQEFHPCSHNYQATGGGRGVATLVCPRQPAHSPKGVPSAAPLPSSRRSSPGLLPHRASVPTPFFSPLPIVTRTVSWGEESLPGIFSAKRPCLFPSLALSRAWEQSRAMIGCPPLFYAHRNDATSVPTHTAHATAVFLLVHRCAMPPGRVLLAGVDPAPVWFEARAPFH